MGGEVYSEKAADAVAVDLVDRMAQRDDRAFRPRHAGR
jgi:hypothetical protein